MLNRKNTKIMDAITKKIKELLKEEESGKTVIIDAEFLWVDNYQIKEGELEIPIAIFYKKGLYYFATGASVYTLKREYKKITTFDIIAEAIWQLYNNQ